MSNVPGINAKHAIITPTCRRNRTDHGAWLEAVDRLQQEYQRLLKARGEDGAHYHLVLSVEARKPLTATEKLRNIQDALNDDDGPAPDQDYDEPSAVELYESTKESPRTAKLCRCGGDCKGHFNCRIVWNDEALAREGLVPEKDTK